MGERKRGLKGNNDWTIKDDGCSHALDAGVFLAADLDFHPKPWSTLPGIFL